MGVHISLKKWRLFRKRDNFFKIHCVDDGWDDLFSLLTRWRGNGVDVAHLFSRGECGLKTWYRFISVVSKPGYATVDEGYVLTVDGFEVR